MFMMFVMCFVVTGTHLVISELQIFYVCIADCTPDRTRYLLGFKYDIY